MLRRILLAALCAMAAGCGTAANQRGDCWWHTCYRGPGNLPYGGVEQDWGLLKGIHGFGGDTLEWGNVLSGSLALFDLPFSAIGDTVLLPYDVRATMNGRWEQPDADKPSAEN